MKKTSGKRRAREKVSKTMTLKSFAKSIRSTVVKFISTMATALSPPRQSGIDGGGPIRFSSRLKEGRALAQDVWSIYKFVLITPSLPRTIAALTVRCCSAANLPPDCINLGQGYMNFAPPAWIREAAEEALQSVTANHYSHPKGRLRLREAIKKHYEPDFARSLDVDTEILVTSGANEG